MTRSAFLMHQTLVDEDEQAGKTNQMGESTLGGGEKLFFPTTEIFLISSVYVAIILTALRFFDVASNFSANSF